MLSAIYAALRNSGIEIPYPKRDVFVHLPDKPTALMEKLKESQPEKKEEKDSGEDETEKTA